ncbi:hypothetical protein FSARC_14191 [Fusarium sarcochroum]|uniref:Uncharacterized protein n=1 Tax=Fusarium sarcochroum TaxID=1208366 RepID=A0A8H4SVS9_9HYPO|nr:hypothetical protein FSARC_14191 [Fusarium sarcochroum]
MSSSASTMSSPASTMYSSTGDLPPACFKIYMPLSNVMDAERQTFHINIKNLDRWRDNLKPKRRANKVAATCQATGANNGKWTITNGSFDVGNEEDFPAPEPSVAYEPGPPGSTSSSDYRDPMYTLEEFDLLGRTDELGAYDAKVLAERMKTHLILEGKLTPPPNRDYEGDYAPDFRAMAAKEARDKRHREHALRVFKDKQPVDDSLQGWRFIHDMIHPGLMYYGKAHSFPVYHPNQRAYILTQREINGRMITTSIRNLDACSKNELLKLVNGIERHGWQDVIYVTIQGENIPYNLKQDGKAETLDWCCP